MTDLESLIVKEANRQGFMPNESAIRQASIDVAGATMTSDGGMIHLPGKGVISPADFVRDLHGRMPHAFANLADERKAEPAQDSRYTGLTEEMRQEVAANRRQRALPVDWLAVRSKATGTTALHMAERERNWR